MGGLGAAGGGAGPGGPGAGVVAGQGGRLVVPEATTAVHERRRRPIAGPPVDGVLLLVVGVVGRDRVIGRPSAEPGSAAAVASAAARQVVGTVAVVADGGGGDLGTLVQLLQRLQRVVVRRGLQCVVDVRLRVFFPRCCCCCCRDSLVMVMAPGVSLLPLRGVLPTRREVVGETAAAAADVTCVPGQTGRRAHHYSPSSSPSHASGHAAARQLCLDRLLPRHGQSHGIDSLDAGAGGLVVVTSLHGACLVVQGLVVGVGVRSGHHRTGGGRVRGVGRGDEGLYLGVHALFQCGVQLEVLRFATVADHRTPWTALGVPVGRGSGGRVDGLVDGLWRGGLLELVVGRHIVWIFLAVCGVLCVKGLTPLLLFPRLLRGGDSLASDAQGAAATGADDDQDYEEDEGDESTHHKIHCR